MFESCTVHQNTRGDFPSGVFLRSAPGKPPPLFAGALCVRGRPAPRNVSLSLPSFLRRQLPPAPSRPRGERGLLVVPLFGCYYCFFV